MQVISKTGFVPDVFHDLPQPDWADYTGGRAVVFPVDGDVAMLAPYFAGLTLVVIPFATSADGRGFSIAAALRAMGFAGHIRARGHVLVDQFRAALRSGFDDVQIPADQAQRNPSAQWQAVPHTPGYQGRVFAE